MKSVAAIVAIRTTVSSRARNRRGILLRSASSGSEGVGGAATSLRQVIIVHRHGARFPTKPTGPGDLSWPQRLQFWKAYSGQLTPVGHRQLQDLGESLRRYYASDCSDLFADGVPADGNSVACYTSNVQRTLQSAWSFLLGFLQPRIPIFFTFRSDRIVSDKELGRISTRRGMGVPIFIEDTFNDDDKLFHEWTLHDDYPAWRSQNMARSPLLRELASDGSYQDLADRLYVALGLKGLDPEQGMLGRLLTIKDVDTIVSIEKANGLSVLSNEEGLIFTDDDLDRIRRVGNEVKRCWFQESVHGRSDASFGRHGAGYLAHKISRHLHDRAMGTSRLRVVEFSCHDTTLAALANCLGVELPEIGFAAHFLLELHEGASASPDTGAPLRKPVLKALYNSRPTEGVSRGSLVSRQLPLNSLETAQPWDELQAGGVPLQAFEAHCCIPGVEESFQTLLRLVEESQVSPTRDRLMQLIEANRGHWLSLSQWRLRYLRSFQAADLDADGKIGLEEVSSLLNELGTNADPRVVHLLWNLFDLDSCHKVRDEEFYLIMMTLCGLRGSISRR